MTITVNGEPCTLAEGANVSQLLAQLEIDPRRAAVERNAQLVRRAQHDQTVLAEGDVVEIVTLVGGG